MSQFEELLRHFLEHHELGLRFSKALDHETDRGALLVGAAFLDDHLKQLNFQQGPFAPYEQFYGF